ncbi:phasin family protein, partial [Methylobacterium nigriterrae]|uniref:phasin family protein n=1 Tax=Methylobacterium nigriterrae TaxID=3127512 RepID=UPI0030140EE0
SASTQPSGTVRLSRPSSAGQRNLRVHKNGGGSELLRHSRQNMEAVRRCGVVWAEALQDTLRGCGEASYRQGLRNLDGMSKIAEAASVQEFTTCSTELLRESLQQMVQDRRVLVEIAVQAADEAAKALSSPPRASA